LFHFNPLKPKGERFVVDSKEPALPINDFMHNENRFKVIETKNPELAVLFLQQAEADRNSRWEKIQTLRGL
jgi:pyruvate-ferredoxin/flavodoxin oxidoreductase